jgi:hypothetical protein
MITGIFDGQSWQQMFHYISAKIGFALPILIAAFILVEWLGREKQYALQNFGDRYPSFTRWTFYYTVMAIIFYYAGAGQEFIYFQF